MLDLQEFCRVHGEEMTFDLDRVEGAAPVRLTALRARVAAPVPLTGMQSLDGTPPIRVHVGDLKPGDDDPHHGDRGP